MRAIMVMFDTLTRKFLPNYGNTWVQAPNFQRLEEHCTRFDCFYGGSLPCIPARRELHTGKYNFLHRSWGPLEPFDNSVMDVLRSHGVYSHLITDHSHYWEDGGATYHNRFDSWEGFRGQEGDRFVARDTPAAIPKDRHSLNKTGISVDQHYHNRTRQQRQEDMSGVRTFQCGLDFLKEHKDLDNWFVQIESFDPHEPFYVPQKYRDLYGLPEEETLNWPRYGMVPSGDYRKDLEDGAKEYAALLSLCDENLGKILDFMDQNNMWKDTMLIVNTDHGFLLGEHECLGKNFPPLFDELVHLPFFLHVPGAANPKSISQLCSTVDIAPTLLDAFGCDCDSLGDIDGVSLLPLVKAGTAGRTHALYGIHGSYTCYTDGEYTFMKAGTGDAPFFEYTLMPVNMRGFFSSQQLKEAHLVPGSRYSNGIPCLKIPGQSIYHSETFGDRLYCLSSDPQQTVNLLNDENRSCWEQKLSQALTEAGAPEEEFARLGL